MRDIDHFQYSDHKQVDEAHGIITSADSNYVTHFKFDRGNGHDADKHLSSYTIMDGTNVVERAQKINGQWVVEHADAKGQFHKVTGVQINDVVLNEHGNISRIDNKGLDHEIDTATNYRLRHGKDHEWLAIWDDKFKERREFADHPRQPPEVEKPHPKPEPVEPPPPVPPRPPEPTPEPRPEPHPEPHPEPVLPPVEINDDPPIPKTKETKTFEVTGNPVKDGRALVELLQSDQLHGDMTLIIPPGRYEIPNDVKQIQLHRRDGGLIRLVGCGDQTIISGGPADGSALRFKGCSNFTIENMTFDTKSALHDLKLENCENVIVRGNVFKATRPRGGDDNSDIQVGGACKNIEFSSNTVFAQGGQEGTKTHCIYIGSGDAQTHQASQNITIRNNDLHYSGGECGAMVQFNSDGKGRHRNALVEKNKFHSEEGQHPGRDFGGGGIALAGIDDIKIRNNEMTIARGAFIEVWGGGVGDGFIENNNFQLTGAPRSRDKFVLSARIGNVQMTGNNSGYNGQLRDMRRAR